MFARSVLVLLCVCSVWFSRADLDEPTKIRLSFGKEATRSMTISWESLGFNSDSMAVYSNGFPFGPNLEPVGRLLDSTWRSGRLLCSSLRVFWPSQVESQVGF